MNDKWPNLCDPDSVLTILMTTESAVKIAWISWNEFSTELEILQMYKLKEIFEKERHDKRKQMTLMDVFKGTVTSSCLWFLQMLLELILMISEFLLQHYLQTKDSLVNKVSLCQFYLFFVIEHNAFCHFEGER